MKKPNVVITLREGVIVAIAHSKELPALNVAIIDYGTNPDISTASFKPASIKRLIYRPHASENGKTTILEQEKPKESNTNGDDQQSQTTSK